MRCSRVARCLEFDSKVGDNERDKTRQNALAHSGECSHGAQTRASAAGPSADATTSTLKRDDPSQIDRRQRRLEEDREDKSRSTFEI